jgi:hypothetical protein
MSDDGGERCGAPNRTPFLPAVLWRALKRQVALTSLSGQIGMKFGLNTPSYAIGDIAGDLEDDKIVFAERLLQEGLVVSHWGCAVLASGLPFYLGVTGFHITDAGRQAGGPAL